MTKQCIRPTSATTLLICVVLSLLQLRVEALNVVIAGGTGEVGRALSAKLASEGHSVTILCRNSFLASAPARVSSDFGWLGEGFLSKHPTIKLRDWDGGGERFARSHVGGQHSRSHFGHSALRFIGHRWARLDGLARRRVAAG